MKNITARKVIKIGLKGERITFDILQRLWSYYKNQKMFLVFNEIGMLLFHINSVFYALIKIWPQCLFCYFIWWKKKKKNSWSDQTFLIWIQSINRSESISYFKVKCYCWNLNIISVNIYFTFECTWLLNNSIAQNIIFY